MKDIACKGVARLPSIELDQDAFLITPLLKKPLAVYSPKRQEAFSREV